MNILIPADYEISALLPADTSSNYQSILVTDSQARLFMTSKPQTIIRHLASRHSLCLPSLKANSRLVTAAAQLQPLAFSPDLLLVPLKVQQPAFSGDSTIGYVNFHHIAKLQAKHAGTSLLLHNGSSIHVLWQERTVKAHLRQAKLAALVQEKEFSSLAERFLFQLFKFNLPKSFAEKI